MFRKSATNNESGVALLFALGILSLLLILGLAFASNALLAQKVAANNSNRSQAKLLAQSAISRIAIAVMYYQYQATTHSPVVIPIDYSDVYSYGQDRDNRVFADGLFSTNDSLLTPPSSVTTDTPTSTTYERPKWAFVFDKPESDSDRKIIGRIAYQQVKGSSGMSKISLNNVLRGVYEQESHSTGTPVTNQIPWTNRWGKSIDELNLNNTTPLNNWEGLKPDESSLDVSSFSSFFEAYKGSGEYFYNYTTVDSQGYKNKSFIERWFTEGTNPMEPEYYRYNITSSEYKLLHRFNLGELEDCDLDDEEWYDRFRNDTSVTLSKNSDAILDRLAHDGVEFRLTDDNTPADTGIPFLKQIADAHETFESLAHRRKQIAANLNDYCDSDSKPTSDVDATNWSVNEGVTEPTFTGNERTPYIYELGYRFAIHQQDEARTAGIAAETNGNIRFRLELYPAVKLAQIYKDVPAGFTGFSFKNSVREITLEGKITGATYHEIKYKYAGTDGAEIETSASITLPIPEKESLEKTFSGTWTSSSPTNPLHAPDDTANTLSFSSTLSGYPFQAADMTGTNPCRWYCDLSAENLLETNVDYLKTIIQKQEGHTPTGIVSGPTSITVDKVEITNIAVKRGPLLLLGTYSDGEGGSSTFGVDYVRSPSSALESTETITFSNSTSDTEEESSFKFLLGGIRGIDPRQNLNENDWFVAARVARGDAQWDAVMDVTSDTPITGKANALHGTDAPPHPFDPGAATDTSRYDIERQAANNGPAWGDDTNHLSTAYIRNAPMQSLWELGVIHRGAAWQTLNLKAAGAPGGTGTISPSDMRQGLSWDNSSGTSYAEGDGGILEQVKLTEKAYSYGLVNINMLCSDTNINEGYQSEYDDQMGQALFYYIKYGQEINDFETNGTGTALESTGGVVSYLRASTNRPFASRTQFLDWSSGGNSLANAFGVVSMTNASDAQQEEIVGKTINLLKAEQSASNVIQFIVVAQTIRDVAGTGITKINPENNTAVSRDCQYGVFDAHRYKNGSTVTTDPSNTGEDTNTSDQSPDDYLYFDEITSEVKMLVTLEKVSEVTGQIVVTSIEYID